MKWRSREDLGETTLSVLDAVKERPGVHFRALGRAANITSMGQLRHHLDALQRRGLVFEIEDGRYRRYFVAGEQPAQLRQALTCFSRPVSRRIAKALLRGPRSRTELRDHLRCADSTLGYHLARMMHLGEVVKLGAGNQRRYALASPVTVRRALHMQEAGRDGDGAVAPAPRPRRDEILVPWS